jgi:hypothetical protein
MNRHSVHFLLLFLDFLFSFRPVSWTSFAIEKQKNHRISTSIFEIQPKKIKKPQKISQKKVKNFKTQSHREVVAVSRPSTLAGSTKKIQKL